MATKKKEKSELSYNVRDIVLAKVRGFPPWPGMVVDPDDVPKSVQRERPKGSKALFYCVKFFPAGDHSWSLAKDMSRLQKHEIEAYIAEPHKKNGDLLSGYRIALDPVQWEKEQEEKQALAAEEEAALEVDQLDADAEADEGSDEPKKPAKKRKRESDSGATKPKKKKSVAEKSENAPKKRRKSTKEGASEEPGPSKTSPSSAKKAKRDKDADAEDGEDAALANDPEAQKVKEWRHRLQRGFLGKTVPPETEMAGYDETFTTVEKYDKLTIEYLSFSKIGKVMRKIAALDPPPPMDEEYNFKARAAVLVGKWQKIISKGPGKTEGGEADEQKEKNAAPVVNGNGTTKEGEDVAMGESRPRETSGEADMEIDPPKAD